ncbi:sugar O-acetyltransferase [Mordavella massiliensis]|nr:sugar O-acetyltransferase [Mordavella massiliensis]
MRKQFSEEEERRRMMEGKLYLPTGEELLADQAVCLERLYEYNHTRPSQNEEREALLKEMFAEIGEGVYLEPPFHANWAGHHVHMGKNVYANFNLTLVDDGEIYIGDYTMIGPNVTIATAGHPVLPELRQEAYQFNIPVHIGKNVWIGAGVIILPGVTVGDNTVIGAGSVVTKDIPSDVVAAGNPCRVLRPIGEKDRIYYYKDQKIDL